MRILQDCPGPRTDNRTSRGSQAVVMTKDHPPCFSKWRAIETNELWNRFLSLSPELYPEGLVEKLRSPECHPPSQSHNKKQPLVPSRGKSVLEIRGKSEEKKLNLTWEMRNLKRRNPENLFVRSEKSSPITQIFWHLCKRHTKMGHILGRLQQVPSLGNVQEWSGTIGFHIFHGFFHQIKRFPVDV